MELWVVPANTSVITVFGRGREESTASKYVQVIDGTFSDDGESFQWKGRYGRQRRVDAASVWKLPLLGPAELACQVCRATLPRDNFHSNQTQRPHVGTCRPCHRVKYRTEYAEGNKSYRRRSLYGLSDSDYQAMRVKQGYACFVCKLPEQSNRSGRSLCIDHDHDTGKIRGLLCTNCNLALGYASDSASRLRLLADYVESFSD